MMRRLDSLTSSILFTVVFYLLGQIVFYNIVISVFEVRDVGSHAFYVYSTLTHAALLVFLFNMRTAFYLVDTQKPQTRLNLPNTITMFRISALPTVLYLLLLSRDYPINTILVTFTILVFLTDFVDGLLSRVTGQVTKVGQYLDSMSDYGVLVAVSVAFRAFHLVPNWLFVIIIGRLGFQWLGMGVLFLYQGGYVDSTSSFFGKASVFAIMSLYAFALLRLLIPMNNIVGTLTDVVQVGVAGVVVASWVDKAVILARDFRHEQLRRRLPAVAVGEPPHVDPSDVAPELTQSPAQQTQR